MGANILALNSNFYETVEKKETFLTISEKVPVFNLNASEHFWVSGIKRGFNLNIVVALYVFVSKHINDLPRNKDLEFTTKYSTISYMITDEDEIKLITGWRGSRYMANKKGVVNV